MLFDKRISLYIVYSHNIIYIRCYGKKDTIGILVEWWHMRVCENTKLYF